MGASLRGQPLAVIVLLVGGWIAFRTVTWQPPGWAADIGRHHRPVLAARDGPAVPPIMPAPPDPMAEPGLSVPAYAPAYWLGAMPMPAWPGQAAPVMLPAAYAPPPPPLAGRQPHHAPAAEERSAGPGQAPLLAAGHQLMWMAALARVAVPPELSQYMGGQGAPAAPAPVPLSPGLGSTAGPAPNRWSADAWMLVRKQAPMSLAASRPLYGGSQVGAVLRYQLDPGGAHRPIAYLRGSSSMGMVRESEAAMGVAARPLASVPVMVGAEARAFHSAGRTFFRPAAIAYTELQPVDLPWDMLGEAYFQAGYVGGRFKTPFVDGQVRVDKPLAGLGRLGLGDIRVGAGLWGGAQHGASRLDAGPGATASLKLLGKPARVSMDYRFRIAGQAEPGSGPAVTLSAGF